MKKFTQTLAIGMMAILLITLLFGAQPVRADGTATVEFIKNPKAGFAAGRYIGTYKKIVVKKVLLKQAARAAVLTIVGSSENKDWTMEFYLPKEYSSTSPCPTVGFGHWMRSQEPLSYVSFVIGIPNSADYESYYSGRGQTDHKADRSGEVTSLSVSGNRANGSFQILCWNESRKNFYHIVGDFSATVDK